ncbi:MAG: hypothetical protein M1825_003142 [Sarcosagium campestre]|nr:MAG: hypothetical protein M1825_003142 [Sarcosagium campestre]
MYEAELTLLGPSPSKFNFTEGTARYLKLNASLPDSPLLRPPPGAPSGTVGVEQCRILAGPHHSSYGTGDALDAVITWLVPLLILVVNINYAAFKRYPWNEVTIAFHLLGNPLHAIWSLATKLDVKRRIERRVRQGLMNPAQHASNDENNNGNEDGHIRVSDEDVWIYTTILYALDDFDFSRDFEQAFTALMAIAHSPSIITRDIKLDVTQAREAREACKRAAIDLRTPRINNTRRALFAVLGYLAAFTTNMIRACFGDAKKIQIHISHTIALRQLNFWLITAIILSAKVGGLPSEWTAVGVLLQLQRSVPCLASHGFRLDRIEPWSGGNYTWRPTKNVRRAIFSSPPSSSLSSSGSRATSTTVKEDPYQHIYLAFLAFLSVTIPMLAAFTMSYLTPTRGIGARAIIELSYWGWWVANGILIDDLFHAVFNWMASTSKKGNKGKGISGGRNSNNTTKTWLTPKKRWLIIILVKDVPSVLAMNITLFYARSGWWNSCYHWSTTIGHGHESAYIDLVGMKSELLRLMRYRFPIVIGLGVLFQGIVIALLLWPSSSFSSDKHRQRAQPRRWLWWGKGPAVGTSATDATTTPAADSVRATGKVNTANEAEKLFSQLLGEQQSQYRDPQHHASSRQPCRIDTHELERQSSSVWIPLGSMGGSFRLPRRWGVVEEGDESSTTPLTPLTYTASPTNVHGDIDEVDEEIEAMYNQPPRQMRRRTSGLGARNR